MSKATMTQDNGQDFASSSVSSLILDLGNYHPRSPFRQPDWRWRLACVGRTVELPAWPEREGPWVRRASDYQDLCEQSGLWLTEPAARDFDPLVHDALVLKQHRDPLVPGELEAWLLTGEPAELISGRCGLPADLIEAYEALFFNVSDRLEARDYIFTSVLIPTDVRPMTFDDHARIWKFFAYFRGRHTLDAMIQAFPPGTPRPWPEEADHSPAMKEQLVRLARMLVRTYALTTEQVAANFAAFLELATAVNQTIREGAAFRASAKGGRPIIAPADLAIEGGFTSASTLDGPGTGSHAEGCRDARRDSA